MDVCRECCVLSGRGLCVGLITRPEGSYRLWCAWVWSRILDNEEAVAHWELSRRRKRMKCRRSNAKSLSFKGPEIGGVIRVSKSLIMSFVENYRVIPSVLDPRKCEYLKDYSLFNLIFLNIFYIYKILNIFICKYITKICSKSNE
jgi:hypothetical protein